LGRTGKASVEFRLYQWQSTPLYADVNAMRVF
jgi:hypothetical protein